MNILVIRLSALGDVAMTIPAIYSVAKSYPQHTFYVLTTVFCARLFVNAPANIVLRPVTDKSLMDIVNALRTLQVDAVADLHNVLISWIIDFIMLLKGKRVAMLDKRRSERRMIIRYHKATERPFTMRYFDVFARLGLPCEPAFNGLFCSKSAALPIGMVKNEGEKWIGIAPFARYSNKTYPLDKMLDVVKAFAALDKTIILLFGSRGSEEAVLQSWTALFPNVISLVGKLSIDNELSVMSFLDVMITMDSANMHLASLVGVRVISIWGSTTPACGFLGCHQSVVDAILSGACCQPCTIAGSDKCKYSDCHCLSRISPKCIVEKTKNVIRK